MSHRYQTGRASFRWARIEPLNANEKIEKSRPHDERRTTVRPALQECVFLVVFYRPPAL